MQNVTENKKNYLNAPYSILSELNNLFFYLNDYNINDKIASPYKQSQITKAMKDGLRIEKIKNALIQSKNEKIKSLYLIGTEPLLHPDYNKILRLCLKFNNTTVITNGLFINEKKARFLRKIDNESNFETIYRINISHWDEAENDKMRGYGNFRRVICALNSLIKYDFNPVINYINVIQEKRENVYTGFEKLFKKYGFDFENINLKFIEYNNNAQCPIKDNVEKLDCRTSRVVSNKGVYACPMLCNDFRARVGTNLVDYSKKICLDTDKCTQCRGCGENFFVNDWIK